MLMNTKSSEFKSISSAIQHTWSNIGHDVQDCCDASGQPIDNESAIEGCLDHITDVPGGEEANAMVARLEREHGHPKVLKFLSKHINLI